MFVRLRAWNGLRMVVFANGRASGWIKLPICELCGWSLS